MNSQSNLQITPLLTVLKSWKLNKVMLASKMQMNAHTFKMKLLGTYPQYRFKDTEIERLQTVLKELAADIENVKATTD